MDTRPVLATSVIKNVSSTTRTMKAVNSLSYKTSPLTTFQMLYSTYKSIEVTPAVAEAR